MKNAIVRAMLLPIVFCAPAARAADVAGSADHPLITRFPGSEITWYEVQEFQPYRIATGPVTGYKKIDDWIAAEGRLTRINYELRGDTSMFEVYSNYAKALKAAGFEMLAEGYAKDSSVKGDVGHRGFLGVHYGANAIPPGKSSLLAGSATSGGSGYAAARLDRPEGMVYVIVGAAQYRQDLIVAMVDIVEAMPMKTDRIAVDADAMRKEIEAQGSTVLHGVLFDHDKATIKPESKPALDEIAKLLTLQPGLKAYIVGHTDMSGSLDYNIGLSRDRAHAVATALTRDYGIAGERLAAHGVGPLSPASSNATDAGKALNRRVELVGR